MKTIISTLLCCLVSLSAAFAHDGDRLKAEALSRISAPTFAARHYLITDYYNGHDTLYTAAINGAIAACSEAGGGVVEVPTGIFKTGPIRMRSNVNLHMADGAVLKFTADRRLFPIVLTRIEGIDCYNLSPLIYAYDEENIAVTGRGRIDGGATADNWFTEAWMSPEINGKKRHEKYLLDSMLTNNVPMESRRFTIANGYRPQTINFYKCRNILLEDFEINNAPFWLIHPLLSQNITVRRVTMNSHFRNNDGCDPESCSDVLIEDCHFNTGDDCIAIKSGKDADGRRWNIPSENIIVRRCSMKDGHAGVAIGSEISGNCKNVWVEDCRMDSPNLVRIVRMKSNPRRGGEISNVFVSRVDVGQCDLAILGLELKYWFTSEGDYTPYFHDIYLDNITSRGSRYVLHVDGFEDKIMVRNISFSHCRFDGVKAPEINQVVGAAGVKFSDVKVNGRRFKAK